ncbi:glycoside hydrolase family 16 protein [Dacryopinax primogenitus]|uniref:Glycoside hydrolase family 16 protein n=1 Tax=Dacryopinax primogenitus (strain DJM 731) TaxID=1858805 RepID=M5FZ53_DACPD|nr:glycoside hydrolase family 16 protein [Dacryopinax primogenitus]EJU01789.1 glycoside hydrolase family 16 protein [Dacryopinax primogenitus]
MLSTSVLASASVLLSLAGSALAQGCGPGTLCPAATPCCSEFGFCGSGSTYCRGGCNALWSHSLTSCEPEPICQSATYDFTSPNASSLVLMNATGFNNDATRYAWTLDKGNIAWSPQGLGMILTETNGGTRLSTTRYVDYGTITASLKTGRWGGVVTAFITMSDVKDEIDWEFPGSATTQGQSNYYWLGVANYSATNGETTDGLSDTYDNFHNFTIDWQPETLQWLVDGAVVRTVQKNDTLKTDSSGTRYEYPSTPSRVQISIWPAGISSSAQGTIEWGGGMINWADPDYVANNNSFVVYVENLSIVCSSWTQPAPGAQSYIFTGNDSTGVPQIGMSNQSFISTTGSTLVALAAVVSL